VDQGDPAGGAGAVAASLAPPRARLTPTRVLLLTLGAVLGGLALSLLMNTSPAHAADGDEGGAGGLGGPLVAATSSVTGSVTGAVSTVSSTLQASIPVIHHSVDAVGGSIATHVPVAAPLVTPVVSTVDATLDAVQQLVAPTVSQLPALPDLLPVAHGSDATQLWTPPAGSGQLAFGSSAATPPGGDPAGRNGGGSDGMVPGPVLTSASGSPAATLALLLGALALVLLGARRRGDNDALPASPFFDTDTSPA